MGCAKCYIIYGILFLLTKSSFGFVVPVVQNRHLYFRSSTCLPFSSLSSSSSSSSSSLYSPRTGILQTLLDFALNSPLWQYVLVPQARRKMEDTAADNGIPWLQLREWMQSQDGPWQKQQQQQQKEERKESPSSSLSAVVSSIPAYYKDVSFHAYKNGNLCWEAAWEQEIASAAVGARNFPAYGKNGETAFRESFRAALQEAGASHPNNEDAIIVDLGCGTGMSTRQLARQYPNVSRVIGIDLSPYYIQVGRTLLQLAPIQALEDGGPWINDVLTTDGELIQYQQGDAANTGLPDSSVDVVNLQFVAHELPFQVTLDIFKEAHRILKPKGQLWFCEMDFQTPGYAAQRANPLLFSLIRATEPYLDEYADHITDAFECLRSLFEKTTIVPATGRHFSIVATKGGSSGSSGAGADGGMLEDFRFDENGKYKLEDTHLKLWENKHQ